MTRILLVGLAGSLGTVTRYLVGLAASRAFGESFPYGTLIVNLLGCFLIAAVAEAALTPTLISPTLRLALTTGFLGGLTTYSSFNLETTRLFQDRAWAAGLVNLLVTATGCFLAGLLGAATARRFVH